MTMIYDFNKFPYSTRHGMYGGNAGFKDGIVINSENWLLKYPKSTKGMDRVDELLYTESPLSEYIGSHIYEILGYDVHETILGIKDSKIVVACKDFLDKNEYLLEFRTMKNAVNKELRELLENELQNTRESHNANIDELLIHLNHNELLQLPGLKERFWDVVVIDSFINNNDRNNGNWGIIRGENGDRLAPIFDNGGSFYNKLPESRMLKIMDNPLDMERNLCNVVTIYSKVVDGKVHNLNIQEMIELNIEDLNEAILRVVPKIKEKITSIHQFIMDIPEEFNGSVVITSARKKYYSKSLDIHFNTILEPYYKKLIG